MPSVTLDRMWLHDGTNLASSVSFFTTGRSDSRSTPGEVRQYASGRLRTISRTGSRQELRVAARQVTDANLVVLDGWRGELLMLRDHRGRLVWGSYFGIDVQDYQDRSGYDVSFTFYEVTTSLPAV